MTLRSLGVLLLCAAMVFFTALATFLLMIKLIETISSPGRGSGNGAHGS